MQIFTMNLDGTNPSVAYDDSHPLKTNQQLIDMALILSSGKHAIVGENLSDETPDYKIFHVVASNSILVNHNLLLPNSSGSRS